jgi:chromosomal replication initiation ATPase DnaA
MCPLMSRTCERASHSAIAIPWCDETGAAPIRGAVAAAHERRLRTVIEASVGQVLNVTHAEFAASTRGRARAALARQIAMYLGHVVCGLSLTDAGRIFARDRTTVAHACAVVEDQRDDPRFDHMLDLLEAIIRWRLWPRAVRPFGTMPGEAA